ncbi:uncharacterized protein LOC109709134 [Ananas comosus]|uniref:Uncharacterized protein LOC109709134 n=1 Tax=Ananas comosus TaxID=4615 RepID=A0A6P5F005_ANACO|nr:uncharacterized protein LOC109709134 [Ananas comosus]
MDPKIAPYSQNSDLKSANKFKDEEQFEEEEEEGVGELVEEVDEKERGWSRLKKAAVAGAAVAAAPAVVPPALALSAVGIALSLPFAACLAALACTHCLIRALLPSSSPYHYQSGRSIEHPRFGFDLYTSDEDDELLYSEEVIWDQIEALRTILGYSDTLHSSCAAELRALLVFTGVEPPISLNDPFDPIGVSDNLRFLKFLVGVK